MKNNDSTQIVSLSEDFMELIKSKKAINDLKKLMDTEEILYDEDADYDEERDGSIDKHHNCDCDKILDTLVKLCESNGKIKPKETVKKLEELLLDSKPSLNPCFFSRYIRCLTCSCNEADESYIQSAVDKLRYIIENMEDSDITFLIESFIFCLSKLSAKQETAQAKITIQELKTIGDEANAWENVENVNRYCLALMYLGSNQESADDLQGLYETSKTLESIVNTSSDTDDLTMFICYAATLGDLCKHSDVSISETINLVQRLENILERTQSLGNVTIAKTYMASLSNLELKQKEQSLCRKKTFERASSIAENARYKNNDDIMAFYALNLIYQMDESDIDNVKFTFSKMEELASRPHLKYNDFFNEHYIRIKKLYENTLTPLE